VKPEVKFLWRDSDGNENSLAKSLVNYFIEGIEASDFSEAYKLHIVQSDNKIDYNICVKAEKKLPSGKENDCLKRIRTLRAPDFGASNTWVYNSFDLDLEVFHSEDIEEPIFFDMFIRFSTYGEKALSTPDKLKDVGKRAGNCYNKTINFLFGV
jgi:hypothetical protein